MTVPRTSTWFVASWFVAALALIAASCSGPGEERAVLVFAAASLSDAFEELEIEFEAANPGVDILLNLAGSSSLREQLLAGAPADVFAAADAATMQAVADAGLVDGEPQVFAANHLAIAVPYGNPAGVTGLGDFGRSELLLGLCAEGVPCGDYARQALASAGVTWDIDTAEPDVRSLLTKVQSGELDAGIVYGSDVVAASELVDGIDLDPSVDVEAFYPIAVLADAPNAELAAEFVDLVRSDAGRKALADAGFIAP